MSDRLDQLCEALGLVWVYRDGSGLERTAPEETRYAVINAMGFPATCEADLDRHLARLNSDATNRLIPMWYVTEPGMPIDLPLNSEGFLDLKETPFDITITTDNGETTSSTLTKSAPEEGSVTLPPMKIGQYGVELAGQRCTLLVAPRNVKEAERGWGVTVPLYGLRTKTEGGIGDYTDLGRCASIMGGKGAGFVGINPVHAGFPLDTPAFSPYAPSSRRHFNIIHIATPETDPEPDGTLIDYDSAIPEKLSALKAAYLTFQDSADPTEFEIYCVEQGVSLSLFALHQVLSEKYGPYWPDWPEALRDSSGPAAEKAMTDLAPQIRFHKWLQWQAGLQLAEAQAAAKASGMAHGLYLDLAVATHPAGAETWTNPDQFPKDISLGAPPDAFSSDGQNWGIAPLDPHKMARDGFAIFTETLRQQMRHAGMIRIDHILGFERAFWVPEGLPGLYVTMPKQAMLAIARIEAYLTDTLIIGEDLGNVPDGLRHDLATSRILGCSVAMFERAWDGDMGFFHPDHYREQALASLSTHDLPTWKGWRSGRDIEWRGRLGDVPTEELETLKQERRRDVALFNQTLGDNTGSIDVAHRHLAATKSRLVAVQIENILQMEEQPNYPGTIHEHPNWRRRLPCSLDQISHDPRLDWTTQLMREQNR